MGFFNTADFWNLFLEMWYIVIAFILLATGINAYRANTGVPKFIALVFWSILAFLFSFGPHVDDRINGLLVIVLGILSFTKQINKGSIEEIPVEFREKGAKRIGNLIFIPSLLIALGAFLFSTILPMFAPKETDALVLGYVSIGLSSLVGLIVAMIITRAPVKTVVKDGTRLMRTMGSTAILPQILGALGAVFAAAGVGDLIAQLLGGLIPDGNLFLGVVAYVVGMAIFTMIMGNAFTAFTVITVGIGIPFVISHGANPVIAGALAMTAGFCGTLMTPMAANFNILSASLLETKSEYSVIKFQVPLAIILLVLHIFLMYFLAFNF